MIQRFRVILAVILLACQATAVADEISLEALREQVAGGETAGLLFFSQPQRTSAFKHIRDLYPTRVVKAGESPFPLADHPADFSAMTYEFEGKRLSLNNFLSLSDETGTPFNKGLIVIKDGDVQLEHYAPGHDRDTRWISFSVTKSLTSLLIGAAIKDGYIRSIDEPVANYLPRLRGTAYETSTIKDVLQMASGVSWNEDYSNPDSDVARAGGLIGLPLVKYLAGLPRTFAPGEKFNYNTGETNLAGEILRAAIGNNASTYLSYKIWQPFGMGEDAYWLLGELGGGETGGCCINATLRDYARIGIFAMRDGRLPDGTRVLPDGWMQASTSPSNGDPGYGYLWWLHGNGDYSAMGIFEQQITISPASGVVIAIHSNAPSAVGSLYGRHLEALTPALVKYAAGL